MGLRVEPAGAGDLDAIASLLTSAFGAPPDAPFVDRRLLQWKYFDSFGPGSLPRSFVLKKDDAIVAHCMAGPLTLRVPASGSGVATQVSAVCFQDWAGARQVPGAGVILMKKLAAQTEVAIVAAGSDASHQAIPRLGFRMRDAIGVYARVVRPLQQARTRPASHPFRDLARLVRNTAWSRTPLGAAASDWTAVHVEAFTTLPVTPDDESREATVAEHRPEYLNYWLRCPAAPVGGYEIVRGGARAGYFLLSRVAGQTRIAGLHVRAAAPADWEQAVRVAARTAAADPSTSEIICLASTAVLQSALDACGFRQRGTLPLFVHDPGGKLAAAPPVAWMAIDDDTAYVYDAASPYQT